MLHWRYHRAFVCMDANWSTFDLILSIIRPRRGVMMISKIMTALLILFSFSKSSADHLLRYKIKLYLTALALRYLLRAYDHLLNSVRPLGGTGDAWKLCLTTLVFHWCYNDLAKNLPTVILLYDLSDILQILIRLNQVE